jgi:hypothetical protein
LSFFPTAPAAASVLKPALLMLSSGFPILCKRGILQHDVQASIVNPN